MTPAIIGITGSTWGVDVEDDWVEYAEGAIGGPFIVGLGFMISKTGAKYCIHKAQQWLRW